MRALLLISALSLCAGGCATAPAEPPPTAGPPAPVAHYDWIFGEDGQGQGGLVFGLEESDDVWISLGCRRGSGQLEMSAASPVPAREIVLIAGGKTGRFPASAEAAEIHEGYFLEARAPVTAPVLQAFRREGWMSVGGTGGSALPMVPHPQTRSQIERFFTFCG